MILEHVKTKVSQIFSSRSQSLSLSRSFHYTHTPPHFAAHLNNFISSSVQLQLDLIEHWDTTQTKHNWQLMSQIIQMFTRSTLSGAEGYERGRENITRDKIIVGRERGKTYTSAMCRAKCQEHCRDKIRQAVSVCLVCVCPDSVSLFAHRGNITHTHSCSRISSTLIVNEIHRTTERPTDTH